MTRRKDFRAATTYTGRLMEVQYKELFVSGSFRYAVTFLRFRDDKDTESFDTKGQMK